MRMIRSVVKSMMPSYGLVNLNGMPSYFYGWNR